MAEHPGVMDPDDYDLSGFCVGLVDRLRMLDPESVREGDVLIGLASSACTPTAIPLPASVRGGQSREELLTPVEALDGQSVADALLTPTRIYVKPVRAVMEQVPGGIRALAHITGGGITENLNRALPAGVNAESIWHLAHSAGGALCLRAGESFGGGGAEDLQHGSRYGADC